MAGQKGMRLRAWGTLRRLPSSKWQASYTGPDLARHMAPITYTAKMDAEYWLADERRRIERDEWTAPADRAAANRATRVTLAQYAATVVAQRTLKPRTRLHYESLLRLHVNDTIGKVPIGALTQAAVRSWHAKLSGAPAAHAYGLVHMVCKTAVGDGLLTSNPCQIMRGSYVRTVREPVVPTIAELATLAELVPAKLTVMILVMAWCGLRWSEVIELRCNDFENDAELLYVRRGATHRGECRIDTPKSGKGRAVVIPPHIRADVKHHLDVYAAKDVVGLMFPPARGGCHFNDRVFRDAIAPALGTIKRTDLHIHDLRHFAGTQTARVGNLVETMARLGHSTVAASLIYQQVVSGRDAEVAAALSVLATGQRTD
jgi:integrase